MFKVKLLGHWLVILAGSALICGSECRDIERLKQLARDGVMSAQHWYKAARLNDTEALYALGQEAIQSDQAHWLVISAEMGDANAIHHLALAQTDDKQKQMLQRAAGLGHAESQFELALLSDSSERKGHWLTQAANQDYLPATIALYQWYLIEQDVEAARP